MAYDSKKLRVGTGEFVSAQYRDNAVDNLAAIQGADFIADAAELGLSLNDPVWIEGTDGAASCRISAISAAGAGTVTAV